MMALAAGQVKVRDLVMGPGTQYKTIDDFNPWGLEVDAPAGGRRAWGDGSWSGVEWATEKIIPWTVHATDPARRTQEGWLPLHQQLAAAFRPFGEDTAEVELRFYFDREYVLFGRPRAVDPEPRTTRHGYAYTRVAFVALDPTIYAGVETVVSGLGLPSFTGGLTVPGSAILNSNTGFETDIAGWFGFRAALSRSTMQAHSGAASLFVDPDGTGSADVGQTDAASVTPGETYSWSAWVYSPAGFGQMTLALQWKDAGGATLADREFDVVAVPAGVWTKLHTTDEAPALSATVTPKVRIKSPTTADTFYVDDAWLRSADHGLTVPFTVPAVPVGGVTTLTNEGTKPNGLTLRIDGPAKSPRVTLLRGDGSVQTLTFGLDIAAGQWLDVDTKRRRVLLNGTANRRGDASGQWPILPAGTHTLRWSASEHNDIAALTVRFRSAWW